MIPLPAGRPQGPSGGEARFPFPLFGRGLTKAEPRTIASILKFG